MENEYYGFIYVTTNLINGKKYIGQKSYKVKDANKYLGSGVELINAIKKYGRENFKREIIENCNSRTELNEREIYWISFYDATNSPTFYNIAQGGEGGDTTINFSEEKRMRVRNNRINASKGKINLGGKNASAKKVICLNTMEIFDSGADAARAYGITPDIIYNCCSKGAKYKTGGIHPETKERLIWEYYVEGKEYKYIPYIKEPTYSKKVICINTGEIFFSVLEASKRFGVMPNTITRWCRGGKSYYIDPLTNERVILKYLSDI